MENLFSEFNPITINESPTFEEISSYYINNNIGTSNEFLDNYLGIPKGRKIEPISSNSSPKIYNIRDILLNKLLVRNNESPIESGFFDNNIVQEIQSLNYSNEDKEYLTKLAKRESGYDPFITNSLGYYGLYQFGKSALKDVGMSRFDFNDTKKQHEAALILSNIYESVNKDLFTKYVGKRKNGILITRNGLRAVNHLLGPKGTREWLEGGNTTKTAQLGHKDAYGTTPEEYLKLFV